MLCLRHGDFVLPVHNMFDVYGEQTTKKDEAVSVIAVTWNGQYVISECQPWEIVEVKPN